MKNNKNKLTILSGILGIIVLASIITIIITIVNKKNDDVDKNVIMVNDEFQELTVDSEDDIDFQNENEEIGRLKIPSLGLSAPIKEGIEQEILADYIGHFNNTSVWDGNVCLASHNRGNSVKHYFEEINKLVNGDTIIYKTKLGERTYQVIDTKEIENTDWSITESTNDKNKITLVTCIANQPEKRFCVIAEEKN